MDRITGAALKGNMDFKSGQLENTRNSIDAENQAVTIYNILLY